MHRVADALSRSQTKDAIRGGCRLLYPGTKLAVQRGRGFVTRVRGVPSAAAALSVGQLAHAGSHREGLHDRSDYGSGLRPLLVAVLDA